MTHRALQISAQLHAALSENIREGRIVPPLNPVARDGIAALSCWQQAGRPVERLRPEDIRLIPADLRLDVAPIARAGVGYILLDRRDWIIIGRVDRRQEIMIAGGIGYAYPDSMLVYLGWRGERRSIFAGCVNLRDTPTVAGLRLSPGRNFGEIGSSPIQQDDADEDLLCVGMCLPRFFGLA